MDTGRAPSGPGPEAGFGADLKPPPQGQHSFTGQHTLWSAAGCSFFTSLGSVRIACPSLIQGLHMRPSGPFTRWAFSSFLCEKKPIRTSRFLGIRGQSIAMETQTKLRPQYIGTVTRRQLRITFCLHYSMMFGQCSACMNTSLQNQPCNITQHCNER